MTASHPTTQNDNAARAKSHTALLDALASDVSGTAGSVVVGLNWTMVRGPHGVGLAHTPVRGTQGCYALPDSGGYDGVGLDALAALRNSANVFEQAIALAAINAHHNRQDCPGDNVNGLDLIEDRGARTAIVGRFPSLETKLPHALVLERDPGPNDYPEDSAADILPNCEQIAITASTLINSTLAGLLELAPNAFIVLVGPSAPLAVCLFDRGVDAISGFVATDVAGLERVVAQGGAVRAMKKFGRNATLRKPD
jgi:hypothetical protein